MKMFRSILASLFFIGSVSTFISCSKDDPAPITVASSTYKDLDADYAPLFFGTNPAAPPTRPAAKNKYTFFNFKTGQLVANTDSATTKWDIGFKSTSIIFNGGTSGPGIGGAIVLNRLFDEVKEAPADGYVVDNKVKREFAVNSSPALDAASATNHWWLNSGSQTSTIVTPIAGRVIVVRTAEGRYAKMQILSFYKGSPVVVDNMKDLDRHYTFRYAYENSTF